MRTNHSFVFFLEGTTTVRIFVDNESRAVLVCVMCGIVKMFFFYSFVIAHNARYTRARVRHFMKAHEKR